MVTRISCGKQTKFDNPPLLSHNAVTSCQNILHSRYFTLKHCIFPIVTRRVTRFGWSEVELPLDYFVVFIWHKTRQWQFFGE